MQSLSFCNTLDEAFSKLLKDDYSKLTVSLNGKLTCFSLDLDKKKIDICDVDTSNFDPSVPHAAIELVTAMFLSAGGKGVLNK